MKKWKILMVIIIAVPLLIIIFWPKYMNLRSEPMPDTTYYDFIIRSYRSCIGYYVPESTYNPDSGQSSYLWDKPYICYGIPYNDNCIDYISDEKGHSEVKVACPNKAVLNPWSLENIFKIQWHPFTDNRVQYEIPQ